MTKINSFKMKSILAIIILVQILSLRLDSAFSTFFDGTITYNGTLAFDGAIFNATILLVPTFPSFINQNSTQNSTEISTFLNKTTFNASIRISSVLLNQTKNSAAILTHLNGTVAFNGMNFNSSFNPISKLPNFKIQNLLKNSTQFNGTVVFFNDEKTFNVSFQLVSTTSIFVIPNSDSEDHNKISTYLNGTIIFNETTFNASILLVPIRPSFKIPNLTTESTTISTLWNGTIVKNGTTLNATNSNGSSMHNVTQTFDSTTTGLPFPNSTSNFSTNLVVNSTPWDRTTFIPANYTNSTVNFTTNSIANSSSWEITTLTSINLTTNFTNITMSPRSTTKRFAFSDSSNTHFQTPNSTTSDFSNSTSFSPKHPTTESSSVPTTPQLESTTERSSTNTGESTSHNGLTTPTATVTIDPEMDESNPATTETPKNVSKLYSVKSGFFDAIFCECSLSTEEFLTEIDHVCCINDDLHESGDQKPIHEAFLFEFNETTNQNYSLLRQQTIQELHIIDSGVYVEFIENYEVLEKVYIHNTKVRQYLLDNLVLNAIALETLYLNRVQLLVETTHAHRNPMSGKLFPFNYQFPPESQLKVLSLINCDIRTLLDVNLAINLTQLQMLSLAYNNLTTLDNPRFFPENASNFYHLDLSYNQLIILDSGSIPETVKILNLSGNPFKQLNFEVFRHFWSTGLEFWIMDNVLNCTHNEVMLGHDDRDDLLWIDYFVFEMELRIEIYGNFCEEEFKLLKKD